MRYFVLITVLFKISFSFSQIEENKLHHKIFNSNSNSNYLLNDSELTQQFQEIKKVEFYNLIENNPEGKFSNHQKNYQSFFEIVNKKEELAVSEISIILENYRDFINNIIVKKLDDEIRFTSSFEVENKVSESEIINIKDFSDKLNYSHKITDKIEVQIGKNIHNYLNKINKTELDKTLQNSLNLLVLNF